MRRQRKTPELVAVYIDVDATRKLLLRTIDVLEEISGPRCGIVLRLRNLLDDIEYDMLAREAAQAVVKGGGHAER